MRARAHLVLLTVAVVSSCLGPSPVHAHEYWLVPMAYLARPGQVVGFGAVAGTGFRGERKPWSPPLTVRLLARTARTIDLTRASSPGDLVWARFAPSDAGGAMLAYESTFTPIELPAAKFDAYLKEEGLIGAWRARRGAPARPGRERYRRC